MFVIYTIMIAAVNLSYGEGDMTRRTVIMVFLLLLGIACGGCNTTYSGNHTAAPMGKKIVSPMFDFVLSDCDRFDADGDNKDRIQCTLYTECASDVSGSFPETLEVYLKFADGSTEYLDIRISVPHSEGASSTQDFSIVFNQTNDVQYVVIITPDGSHRKWSYH